MSRRGKEFNHRTAIFEGAFRAWSHLGGLSPELLQTKSVQELDPTTFVIENDPRLLNRTTTRSPPTNEDGSLRREFAYETLPRSGLLHPYVKAILIQWLGTGVEKEALEIGLGTLRCWWQHRRKGENKTSVKTLGGSDKMRNVLDQYTSHFFELAHCLTLGDNVEAPRSLKKQMNDLEKQRRSQMADGALGDANLTALERQFAFKQAAGVTPSSSSSVSSAATGGSINMKGKCVPGNLDLPELVMQVNRKAALVAYRGKSSNSKGQGPTPMVYCSPNGDCQILMHVEGITCAHCVKIVETVLKGCNGNKSPINGLLDAAADRELNSVFIKIDNPSNAPRIAHEAARNLKLMGYTGRAQSVQWKAGSSVSVFAEAAHRDATTNPVCFDWSAPCTCPDSGVFRTECARHEQLAPDLARALTTRQVLVSRLLQQEHAVEEEDPQDLPPPQLHHSMDDDEPLPLEPNHMMSGGEGLREDPDTEPTPFAYQEPRNELQQQQQAYHAPQPHYHHAGNNNNNNNAAQHPYSLDDWEPLYELDEEAQV